MAQVSLKNVTKVFDGSVTAVDNVSIEVADTEFMVIVGPSGCGKTTTLRMIAGLENVTSGTITIGDNTVNNVPPKDRDVAMVFQNYALYPHMTVFQNMAFGLKLRKVDKAEIKKRVTDAAQMLGIEGLLDRKPEALSGGQRQRVAVGRAIVRNPNVFLFDEPLSNLDAKLRLSTRAELKALQRRLDTTTIYVTHDQAEAMTLGDRVCVMYKGRVQQVAEPMELYNKPANKFVAGFLGTPTMNFLDGKIEFRDGAVHFALRDEAILLPPRMKDSLGNYQNQEMVLGVRPEHISLKPIADQNGNSISCTIMTIEPFGDHMEVYLKNCSGRTIIARIVPNDHIKLGEKVTLYIEVGKVFVFEPGETGKNVSLFWLVSQTS
jgi:multiple sugar transport system ATP-binding protein